MMNFYKNLCGRKGFTLIELVAVTAMLGVLAGMLLPSIDSANKKAKNAKLKNDLLQWTVRFSYIKWKRVNAQKN